MSEPIKHECGLAVLRLRKPLDYYVEKYGTPAYGVNKMYLLMQKQHNRGQDGVGIASIKLDMKPGKPYIDRARSVDAQAIPHVFKKVGKKISAIKSERPDKYLNAKWMKNHVPYIGEVFIGHLRYATHGKNSIEYCHPMFRPSNWRSRNLLVAGNFNMTNVDELFQKLLELGQHPKEKIDTVTVMEKIGHFLDEENITMAKQLKSQGLSADDITAQLEESLDLQRVLKRSCKDFDGGYAMAGITGYGAAFVARDPAGIRPAYYYADDEVVVVASEKPAIKTAFNIEYSNIKEIEPGSALIIDKQGGFQEFTFTEKLPKKSCSFERIYFSRGTDPTIYQERKQLGELLVPQILSKIDHNMEDAVFSYIPNTAETAFLGMIRGLENFLIETRIKAIADGKIKAEELDKLLAFRPRVEKLVLKDVKLRTFITDDDNRDELVAHVYDTTYEVIKKNVDTLVVIDDSIVRGTTLEKSIINMLDRLAPKRIIIVSSAPQIRYPDCYGIDMSRMDEFVAFRAVINLLRHHQMDYLIDEVYEKCKKSLQLDVNQMQNHVKELYAPFRYEEVSDEIARIIRQKHIKARIDVVYQTVENLHKACPNHLGDWYFTGDYPTAGGNRVVNRSFIHFYEGKKKRAY